MKGWGLLVAALLAGSAHAQSSGEISFWESVRDSKDPTELRAYLQQYPNGAFAVLARRRIEVLEQKPAPAAQPSPPRVASAAPIAAGQPHKVQAGDAWTYRLTYPRLRGQWGQPTRPPQTHVVTAASVADGQIIDQLSVDGSSPVRVEHSRGSYLAPEGVSIYSPYLLAFGNLAPGGKLPTITIRDAPCSAQYTCRATGRVGGQENVNVAAGQFLATKVVVEQEWRPVAISGLQSGQLIGGRTLTVWYVPELRRAVKYSSRLTVGDAPPVDSNFDLELVSYQLK